MVLTLGPTAVYGQTMVASDLIMHDNLKDGDLLFSLQWDPSEQAV